MHLLYKNMWMVWIDPFSSFLTIDMVSLIDAACFFLLVFWCVKQVFSNILWRSSLFYHQKTGKNYISHNFCVCVCSSCLRWWTYSQHSQPVCTEYWQSPQKGWECMCLVSTTWLDDVTQSYRPVLSDLKT